MKWPLFDMLAGTARLRFYPCPLCGQEWVRICAHLRWYHNWGNTFEEKQAIRAFFAAHPHLRDECRLYRWEKMFYALGIVGGVVGAVAAALVGYLSAGPIWAVVWAVATGPAIFYIGQSLLYCRTTRHVRGVVVGTLVGTGIVLTLALVILSAPGAAGPLAAIAAATGSHVGGLLAGMPVTVGAPEYYLAGERYEELREFEKATDRYQRAASDPLLRERVNYRITVCRERLARRASAEGGA